MDRCSYRSGVGRVREEKVSRKKIKAREEVEKSRNAVLFQCCVSGGSKSRRRPTCSKHYMFEPLLDVQASLFLAGAMDFAPRKKWAKPKVFAAVSKNMAGAGRLKRICKDKFRLTDAVQETSLPDIRRSGLLRWFCVTGRTFSWQTPYFRHMKWTKLPHFWCCPLRIFQEVSQNFFVLELRLFTCWGSLAQLLPSFQLDRWMDGWIEIEMGMGFEMELDMGWRWRWK